MSAESVDEMGPVDYVLVEWSGRQPTGEALPHLVDLVEIVETLEGRPERFLIYCDDLSFEADDAGYKSLKAVLEGSIAAPAENVLIYASSNRRHLLPDRRQVLSGSARTPDRDQGSLPAAKNRPAPETDHHGEGVSRVVGR